MFISEIGFNRAFLRLTQRVDIAGSHQPDVEFDHAVTITKAFVTGESNYRKGLLYTTADSRGDRAIIAHGDYGWVAVRQEKGRPGYKWVRSAAYVPGSPVNAIAETAHQMAARCICNGISVSSIIQWFDSVHRLETGRHTSPNFNPIRHMQKLIASIQPGIDLLEEIDVKRQVKADFESQARAVCN